MKRSKDLIMVFVELLLVVAFLYSGVSTSVKSFGCLLCSIYSISHRHHAE